MFKEQRMVVEHELVTPTLEYHVSKSHQTACVRNLPDSMVNMSIQTEGWIDLYRSSKKVQIGMEGLH